MKTIWKGALSFGLINIPVNLYTATQERELKFTLLHKKDLSEIRYAKMCKAEEKEVPYSDIVKGYEISEGNYVILTDEDFKKVNIEKSKSIDIQSFVPENEIESIYYEKLYYLEPGKNAEKAYVLLLEALKKSKKVAVAKFVLRNHERMGIIKPHENMLILNQIRFESEILRPSLDLPTHEKIPEKEMKMALQLIEQLTDKFDPSEFKDTYVEDVKAMIEQKSKGLKIKKGKEATKAPSKVHDIMSLLKASLEQDKKPKKKEAKPKKKKSA